MIYLVHGGTIHLTTSTGRRNYRHMNNKGHTSLLKSERCSGISWKSGDERGE